MTVPPVRPWVAEHMVDTDAAADLIGSQFPHLAGAPVRLLAEGWDNTVHVVGGAARDSDAPWAFRFPRRAVAVPGVEREIALLPRLAPALPMLVPVPELVGTPTAGYPWPFFGARLLPGTELAEAGLADVRRAELGAVLGRFLRALHDPLLAQTLGPGLPIDPMRRSLPSHRAPMARERLARLRSRGDRLTTVMADGRIDALLDSSLGLPPSAAEPVLVHGDLHLRHVLVDETGVGAGVIDWGDVCLADATVDLSIAYTAFEGASRAALFDAYGWPVEEEREARARVLAVSLCAVLADYADEDHRPALLAESLAGLRRAVS